ncbi:hypothetical protein K491DRAFT_747531 [Lophiostoma macrostomum CBS 122681]|uniref:Uncharacterized protein n=1 Tax=Lophiostoma macrostomum CBS 122681 TaxID=1314788 RepID=A0A6A6T5D2_9PLEO|nr:hypothetical protein K491DRAFT_747531 [Lophiostoma macrostomum CBS 122681]
MSSGSNGSRNGDVLFSVKRGLVTLLGTIFLVGDHDDEERIIIVDESNCTNQGMYSNTLELHYDDSSVSDASLESDFEEDEDGAYYYGTGGSTHEVNEASETKAATEADESGEPAFAASQLSSMLNPLSISGAIFSGIDDPSQDSDYEPSVSDDGQDFTRYNTEFDHSAYHDDLERTLIEGVLKKHQLATGCNSNMPVERRNL